MSEHEEIIKKYEENIGYYRNKASSIMGVAYTVGFFLVFLFASVVYPDLIPNLIELSITILNALKKGEGTAIKYHDFKLQLENLPINVLFSSLPILFGGVFAGCLFTHRFLLQKAHELEILKYTHLSKNHQNIREKE
ncbi:hypothetical protein D0S45_10690 [Marinifilum sp. JC120]|nr:hypothetical protein D0S45_10690 [Marinifilum sp. JC120]